VQHAYTLATNDAADNPKHSDTSQR
jgi:hypothetical protein